ncbi:MAG: hypothetical protein WB762_23525 [Candidatus Sulfotelmatobacter sp.]
MSKRRADGIVLDLKVYLSDATKTCTRKIRLPDGKVIAPTGKGFDVTFATTAKEQGDLLLEEYVFGDLALQAQQIGVG